jgi:hypothetical protein
LALKTYYQLFPTRSTNFLLTHQYLSIFFFLDLLPTRDAAGSTATCVAIVATAANAGAIAAVAYADGIGDIDVIF